MQDYHFFVCLFLALVGETAGEQEKMFVGYYKFSDISFLYEAV